MTEFIKIGDTLLAAGLRWRALAGDKSPAKEIAEMAADLGSRSFLAPKKLATLVGFVAEDAEAPARAKRVLPAAMAFAAIPNISPNAVFIGRLGEDKWVLLILRDGEPVSGDYEYVGSFARANEILRDYLQFESDTAYVFYGDEEGTQGIEIQPLSFETLAEVELPVAYAIKSIGISPAATFAVIGVVVAAVALGGWYFYDQAEKKKRAALAAATASGQVEINPVELYKTKLPEQLSSAVAGYPAKAMLDTSYLSLGSQPVEIAGWRLKEGACEREQCTLFFEAKRSTFAKFNEAKQQDVSVVKYALSPFGKSIVAALALPKPGDSRIDPAALLPMNDFLLKTGSALQGLPEDMAVTMTDPMPYGVPAEIAGRVGELGAVLVKSGTWSVTGPWLSLKTLMAALPATMTADKIKVTIDDSGIVYAMEGRFYVR